MPGNENIRSLLEKARNGNSHAFSQIYHLTYEKNYGIVNQILKNEQDTKDVLQDTYLKIYQKLEQVQEMNLYSFFAWSRKVALNTALDFLRKQKQNLCKTAASWDQENDIETEVLDLRVENQPELAMLQKEACDSVYSVLEGLPAEQRECAVLFYVQELSIREIADITCCSENTIKSRLYYARKKMQAKLGDFFPE